MIEFGHGTHVGLRRRRNEDTYYADAALGLFLVADGMGGHAHGQRAAALARECVVEGVRAGAPLETAIRDADARIIGDRRETAAGLPMGSTLAALRLHDNGFEAAWVGDSRIYLHQNALRRLSHDHSVVQRLLEHGEIDEEQARHHPQRNLVTQALGVTAPEDLLVECVSGEIEGDMRFLLCSDGLTEEVADATLATLMRRDDIAAQEAVDQLLLAALDAGGHDNVTAILIRLRSR